MPSKAAFNDYEGFVEKFKPKKTTDDCMTPQPIYDALLSWIESTIGPIERSKIIRPFWPGASYEEIDYPADCIVIDNPPFSILAKIRRFYNSRGIRYFLFAPHLTLFAAPLEEETFICANAEIKYENGAIVRTSFVTNMIPGVRIKIAGDLYRLLKQTNKQTKQNKTKQRVLSYPPEVITAARLELLCRGGICIDISKNECCPIRSINKIGIYGGGYIISERLAAERLAAERLAAERLAAERLAAERLAAEVIELGPRELEIYRQLNEVNNEQNPDLV